MSTSPARHPIASFLARRYVELLTVLTVLFALQMGLVPFEFVRQAGRYGSTAFFSATTSHLTFPDTVANIFLYVPVGLMLHWTLSRTPGSRTLSVLLAVGIATALSIGVEWLQAYSPTRVSSVIDLAANVAGASIGALISWTARGALPRLFNTIVCEVRERPRAAALKAYCLALLFFAAIPFSFSFDVIRLKKSVKSANFVPFHASTTDRALADDVLAEGDYYTHAHLTWRRMKRWSRWAAEGASFVVLAWLVQSALRGDYGFGRWTTTMLTWWVGGGLALGLSAMQLLIVSRACDVTDILFRLFGLSVGLIARWMFVLYGFRVPRPSRASNKTGGLIRAAPHQFPRETHRSGVRCRWGNWCGIRERFRRARHPLPYGRLPVRRTQTGGSALSGAPRELSRLDPLMWFGPRQTARAKARGLFMLLGDSGNRLSIRLAKWGTVAAAGYIIYNGVIPLTFDAGADGPAASLSSKSFLPFFAYFTARFDVMMADAMEKVASYAVFSALLALYLTCSTRSGTKELSQNRAACLRATHRGATVKERVFSLVHRGIATTPKSCVPGIVAAGVAMSVVIEVVQMFIPVRVSSLTDPILAAVGCLVGVYGQRHLAAFYRFTVSDAALLFERRQPASRHMTPSDALVATLTEPRPDAPIEPSPISSPELDLHPRDRRP